MIHIISTAFDNCVDNILYNFRFVYEAGKYIPLLVRLFLLIVHFVLCRNNLGKLEVAKLNLYAYWEVSLFSKNITKIEINVFA